MYARIDSENQSCAEFIDFDPQGCFHPELVWAEVPGNLTRWIDHDWRFEDGRFAPPDLDSLRAKMRADIAAHRWAIQSGGMEARIDDTRIEIRSDDDARKELLAARISGGDARLLWKLADGVWHSLTAAQLASLQEALRSFVAACFAREHAIDAALGRITTLDGLTEGFEREMTTGWPAAALGDPAILLQEAGEEPAAQGEDEMAAFPDALGEDWAPDEGITQEMMQ